jgi:hypothetical protein
MHRDSPAGNRELKVVAALGREFSRLERTSGSASDEEREAEALFGRLLAAPAGSRRARPRRPWPRLAVAAALGAAALFATLSLPDSDEDPAPNVVAKAVAALTRPDVIYHSVARMHASDMPKFPVWESWYTTSGRLHRRAYAAKNGGRGRLEADFAGQRRPGRLGGPALSYDADTNAIYRSGFGGKPTSRLPPSVDPFDPARSLRELQAEGRLRVAGRVEVDGKPAYRLVSGDVPGSEGYVMRSEFIVDARTYLPREHRFFLEGPDGRTSRALTRFLTYERLPLNDETRTLLEFDPPAGAKCMRGTGTDPKYREAALGFPNPCAP